MKNEAKTMRDLTARQREALLALADLQGKFCLAEDVKARMIERGFIAKSSPFACSSTLEALEAKGLAQRARYNDRKFALTVQGLERAEREAEAARDRRSGTGGRA